MFRPIPAAVKVSLIAALGAVVGGLAIANRTIADDSSLAYERDVRPVLQRFCFKCHTGKDAKADLRLDELDTDFVDGPDAETWHDVLNQLNLGEMPPPDAAQPDAAQRRTLTAWITTEIERAAQARGSTGGRVVMRRLTRYEYRNTMRDLLGVDLDFSENLPPESLSKEGFKNNGGVLDISPLQIEYYLQAARKGLAKAIVIGPEPQRYQQRAEKSEKVRRVKGEVSNRLGADSRFLVRLDEFPREGEVIVRVRAHADVEPGAGFPRMRVALGVRADVEAPESTLAEVDVTNASPHTFEFRGRIERFPLPGHNPKYPGLQVSVYNDHAASGSAAKQKGKKQKQPKQGTVEPLLVIEWVEFEGPVFASWPPPSHQQILFGDTAAADETTAGEADYARRVTERFMQRAYRRPVDPAEVDAIMRMYERVRPNEDSLEQTMREVLALVLISPDFLYLVEPRANDTEKQPLSNFELASRLSYFLWSSLPDERLFQLASDGSLREPQTLAGEVRRMIADEKSAEFVRHFTDQWLDLAAIDRVAVNPEFFPDFDERVKSDMRIETQRFFAEVLQHDLSCLNFLDSEFAVLNWRLAEHYGVDQSVGADFQRVKLSPQEHRGGLLTQGSFLLSNSNGEDSHPIRRAVWLLDRLLDDPPAPPPPDVPELDPDEPNLAGLSLKKQLEVHRNKEACNDCHRGIDPWGVAFENFDAVGRWRTEVAGGKKNKQPTPVDAAADLPDGTRVDGVRQLKSYLVEKRSRQFARAFVKRLMAYATGRSLELSDQATVDAVTQRFIQNDYRLGGLIVDIVQCDAFQMK